MSTQIKAYESPQKPSGCELRAFASSPLVSTTEPGPGFGKFALPISCKEALHDLVNGIPIQVPRFFLPSLLDRVGVYCGEADIKMETDAKIAQLTPILCRWNEAGRKHVANGDGAHRQDKWSNIK